MTELPKNDDEASNGGLRTTALFGWVACSERLPADFDRVVIQGSGLGCYVGSLYKGVWRVETPLVAADGRRIMIELDDSPRLPPPERWMSLPNSEL